MALALEYLVGVPSKVTSSKRKKKMTSDPHPFYAAIVIEFVFHRRSSEILVMKILSLLFVLWGGLPSQGLSC